MAYPYPSPSRGLTRLSSSDSRTGSMSGWGAPPAPVSGLFTAAGSFVDPRYFHRIDFLQWLDSNCRNHAHLDRDHQGQKRPIDSLLQQYPTIHAAFPLVGLEDSTARDLSEIKGSSEQERCTLVTWSVYRTMVNARKLLAAHKLDETSAQVAARLNELFDNNAMQVFSPKDDAVSRACTFVELAGGEIFFIAPEIADAYYYGQRARDTGAIVSLCNPFTRALFKKFYVDDGKPVTLGMFLDKMDDITQDLATKLIEHRKELHTLKYGDSKNDGDDDPDGDGEGQGGRGKRFRSQMWRVNDLVPSGLLPPGWQTAATASDLDVDSLPPHEAVARRARDDALSAMLRFCMLVCATPVTVLLEWILCSGGCFLAEPCFSVKHLDRILVDTLRREHDYAHPPGLPSSKKKCVTPDRLTCATIFRWVSGFTTAEEHRQHYADDMSFITYGSIAGNDLARANSVRGRMGLAPSPADKQVVVCAREMWSLSSAIRVIWRMASTCRPQDEEGRSLDFDGFSARLRGKIDMRTEEFVHKVAPHVIEARNLPLGEPDEEFEGDVDVFAANFNVSMRLRQERANRPLRLDQTPRGRHARREMAAAIQKGSGPEIVQMSMLLKGESPEAARERREMLEQQLEEDVKTQGYAGFVPIHPGPVLFVVNLSRIAAVNNIPDSYAVLTFPWNCLKKRGQLVASHQDLVTFFKAGFDKGTPLQAAPPNRPLLIDALGTVVAENRNLRGQNYFSVCVQRILALCANSDPEVVGDDVRQVVVDVSKVFGLSVSSSLTIDGISWFRNGFFGTGSSIVEHAVSSTSRFLADRGRLCGTADFLVRGLTWTIFSPMGVEDNPIGALHGPPGTGKSNFWAVAKLLSPNNVNKTVHAATDNAAYYRREIFFRGEFRDDVSLSNLGQPTDGKNSDYVLALSMHLDGQKLSSEAGSSRAKQITSTRQAKNSTRMTISRDSLGSETSKFNEVVVGTYMGTGGLWSINLPPFALDEAVATRVWIMIVLGYDPDVKVDRFYCNVPVENVASSNFQTVTTTHLAPFFTMSTLASLAKLLYRVGVFAGYGSTSGAAKLVAAKRAKFANPAVLSGVAPPRPADDSVDITVSVKAAVSAAQSCGKSRRTVLDDAHFVAARLFGKFVDFSVSTWRHEDPRAHSVLDGRSVVADYTLRLYETFFFTPVACAIDPIAHVAHAASLAAPSIDTVLDFQSFVMESVAMASVVLTALVVQWVVRYEKTVRIVGNYVHLDGFFAIPEEGSLSSSTVPYRMMVLVKRLQELPLLTFLNINPLAALVAFREVTDMKVRHVVAGCVRIEPGMDMAIKPVADNERNTTLRVHVAVLNMMRIWCRTMTEGLESSRPITLRTPFLVSASTRQKTVYGHIIVPPALVARQDPSPIILPGQFLATRENMRWFVTRLAGTPTYEEAVAAYDAMVGALFPPGSDHRASRVVVAEINTRGMRLASRPAPYFAHTALAQLLRDMQIGRISPLDAAAQFGADGKFSPVTSEHPVQIVREFDAQVAVVVMFKVLLDATKQSRLESQRGRQSRPASAIETHIASALSTPFARSLFEPRVGRSKSIDIEADAKDGLFSHTPDARLKWTETLLDSNTHVIDRLCAGITLVHFTEDRALDDLLKADIPTAQLVGESASSLDLSMHSNEVAFCINQLAILDRVYDHARLLSVADRHAFLEAVFDRSPLATNDRHVALVATAEGQGLVNDHAADFARRVVAFRLVHGLADQARPEDVQRVKDSILPLSAIEVLLAKAITEAKSDEVQADRYFVSPHGPLRWCATVGKRVMSVEFNTLALSLAFEDDLVTCIESKLLVKEADDLLWRLNYKRAEEGDSGPVSWLGQFRLKEPDNPDPTKSAADPEYRAKMRALWDRVAAASVFVSAVIGPHPEDPCPANFVPPLLSQDKTSVRSHHPDVCIVNPDVPENTVVGGTMTIHKALVPIGEAAGQFVTRQNFCQGMVALWHNVAKYFMVMSTRNDIFPVCFASIGPLLAQFGIQHGLAMAQCVADTVKPVMTEAEIDALFDRLEALVAREVNLHFATGPDDVVWARGGFHYFVSRPARSGVRVESPEELARIWRQYHEIPALEEEAQAPVDVAIDGLFDPPATDHDQMQAHVQVQVANGDDEGMSG